jgi:hypothetical protein
MRLLTLAAALAATFGGTISMAETVAVLGTGRVGAALGPQFAKHGATVIYGSRDPARAEVRELVARTGGGASAASQAEAVAKADVVVLALPWKATEEVVRGLDLSGKVIIDPTNAIKFGAGGQMEMAVETSAGELIQSWAPNAKVVKAFNTMGFHVMANAQAAGGPVTLLLAGDDAAAKNRVADYGRRMGFEVQDVGPLRHARHLEGMSVIYMVPFLGGKRDEAFEFYLRRGTAPKVTTGVRPAE